MKYTNIHKEVKWLRAAEFSFLYSSVTLIFFGLLKAGAGFVHNRFYTLNEEMLKYAALVLNTLAAAAAFLVLLSCVLRFVGLLQGKKDDAYYGKGIIPSVIAMIAAALCLYMPAFHADGAVMAAVSTFVGRLSSLYVILFVINGITELCEQLAEDAIAKRRMILVIVLSVLWILSAFAAAAAQVISTALLSLPSGLLSAISGILGIISSCIFLAYLGDVMDMLED